MGVQMAAVEAPAKTKSMRERKAAARKSGAFKFLDDLPMPQGKKCKSGTCKMDHKGECFRDPRVGGGYLPKAMTDKALERCRADRAANAVRLKIKEKPAWREGEKGPEVQAAYAHGLPAVGADHDLWQLGEMQYCAADLQADAEELTAYAEEDDSASDASPPPSPVRPSAVSVLSSVDSDDSDSIPSLRSGSPSSTAALRSE